jgi:hypothetical protein
MVTREMGVTGVYHQLRTRRTVRPTVGANRGSAAVGRSGRPGRCAGPRRSGAGGPKGTVIRQSRESKPHGLRLRRTASCGNGFPRRQERWSRAGDLTTRRRLARGLSLNHVRFPIAIDNVAAAGAFEVSGIGQDVELTLTVPINQAAPFREGNQNLRGSAVRPSIWGWIVRRELRIPYHIDDAALPSRRGG